jgi:hypothetical protein
MVRKLIKIYIQGFKYSRRLTKLYKTLDVLMKEFDYTQKSEDKKMLYRLLTELHGYTSGLLREFDNYIENNKFKNGGVN